MSAPMSARGRVSSFRNIISLMEQDDKADSSVYGIGRPSRHSVSTNESDRDDVAEDRLRSMLSDLTAELEQWILRKNMLLEERNMLRAQLWCTCDSELDIAINPNMSPSSSSKIDERERILCSPTVAPPMYQPAMPSEEPAILPLRLAATCSPSPSDDCLLPHLAGETIAEAAHRLRSELGHDACIVCILGGTEFHGVDSNALVQAMASKLEAAMGSKAKFVTGGMAGVQEAFAKHCGDGSHVWNLLPLGQSSGYGRGTDINAGADPEERKTIFGLIGDIYITVEGGPGVAQEARAAHARGAAVVPLIRTGGASSGMFNFPQAALNRPCFSVEEQWSLLIDKHAPVDESAAAVAAIVEAYAGASTNGQVRVQKASTSGASAAIEKGFKDKPETEAPEDSQHRLLACNIQMIATGSRASIASRSLPPVDEEHEAPVLDAADMLRSPSAPPMGVAVAAPPTLPGVVSEASSEQGSAGESIQKKKNSALWKRAIRNVKATGVLSRRSADFFPLRPAWTESPPSHLMGTHSLTGISGSFRMSSAMADDATVSVRKRDHGCMQSLISYPGTTKRIAWDLIGGVFLVFDMVHTPLQVFKPPRTRFTVFMEWLSLVYWTANVIASLTVGYVKDGTTIIAPDLVLRHYMSTWMVLDIVTLPPDWLFTLTALSADRSKSGSEASVLFKALRIFRLARVVRVLRLMKFKWILQMVDDLLDSEFSSIIANVVKMVIGLLLANHILACGWFWLATVHEGPTWTTVHDFENADWIYQYWTSLHWSLTQFTPASMHVQPQNVTERVFAVSSIVLALVVFSYVVGSITGSLNQLRSMREAASKSLWELRRYLRKHQIPLVLSIRIQRYAEHILAGKETYDPSNKIKLLGMLSEPLQNELQGVVIVPHLRVHPLFGWLANECSSTVQHIAANAITTAFCACKDSVFLPGEKGRFMYVLTRGRLLYLQRCLFGSKMARTSIEPGGDWIAEPVLWTTSWGHLGLLAVLRDCEILRIDPLGFAELIDRNPGIFQIVREYAGRFVQWLNQADDRDCRSDLSDGMTSEEIFNASLSHASNEATRSVQRH